MTEKKFYLRFSRVVLWALPDFEIVCVFLSKGKCRSRILLLEKSVFLHKPCAHSSKTHQMETFANNGNYAFFSCFVCCAWDFRLLFQYQTFKWNGILVSCDNRELTSRLLPPPGDPILKGRGSHRAFKRCSASKGSFRVTEAKTYDRRTCFRTNTS